MSDQLDRRILLYCRIKNDDPVNKGAVKKYHGILRGFRGLGFKADILWLSKKGILFNEDNLFPFRLNASMESFRNIFFNHFLFDWAISTKMDFSAYDVFFVRFPLCHPAFFYLLRKAKKANPALKIWLEVPTYPYNLEHTSFIRSLQYRLDRLLQPLLSRYVNSVLHYGRLKYIFNIPAIGIGNGVDVNAFPVSKSIPQTGVLRLLAVGNWNYWHGLDRLLRGLSEYYLHLCGNTKVELKIVGGGRELTPYKAIVENLRLTSYVEFIKPIEGLALNTIFDWADVAIGCLGIHRKNVELDSSLKHREYCARGLPFVLSTSDPDFPQQFPWVFYAPKDESPINILDIMRFFSNLKTEEVKSVMRDYAFKNMDWQVKLGQVPFLKE